MIRLVASITSVVVAIAMLSASSAAWAQNYPSRPVRLILPFGAGGVADVTARIVAEKLGDKLGQRFVIENMPGAGGITAARAVLSSQADGYTLGIELKGSSPEELRQRLKDDVEKWAKVIKRAGIEKQ